MIKRPINPRFPEKVLSGQKTTTIRAKAWPVGVPIMLYHWSGKPYASKHINVAAIIVQSTQPIRILRPAEGNLLYVYKHLGDNRSIWETEGFENAIDMDAWFRSLIKPGCCLDQHLMTFRLAPTQP
jgi:hypothetical protein